MFVKQWFSKKVLWYVLYAFIAVGLAAGFMRIGYGLALRQVDKPKPSPTWQVVTREEHRFGDVMLVQFLTSLHNESHKEYFQVGHDYGGRSIVASGSYDEAQGQVYFILVNELYTWKSKEAGGLAQVIIFRDNSIVGYVSYK